MDLGGVVPIALEVTPHYGLQAFALDITNREL
jgi:hypothetical protein